MADYENPEFVMSQVKLAAVNKTAGDVRQAISLLEQTLADGAVCWGPTTPTP